MAKAKTSRERSTGAAAAAVFLSPHHDHSRCSSDAMAIAETQCAERGQRLTPIRRNVLNALLDSHQPVGAYEIMERLAPTGPRPAPITVYRALEFLRENGFVHRLESLNSFVACVHTHAAGELVVFLICEKCGRVGEAHSAEVAATLNSASRAAGFTPKSPVIEIGGICSHCRSHAAEDKQRTTAR
jgi:Fur family zinc uptake transcriptional regulator